MDEQFNIKTPIFEGPLDTLLSLIEKRKLFINDISLAQVADDYIAYVKELNNFPIADSALNPQSGSGDRRRPIIGDLAHFILIASTLVLIKSKSLLPSLSLSEEEQENINDLEDRLKQYQKFKALATHLREKFGINTSYIKLPSKTKPIIFSPDKKTDIEDLHKTIKEIIEQLPKQEIVPKAVVQKVISLEEMMTNLSDRINKSLKMSFKTFAGHGKKDKVTVIVSFLAMLELVKQGIINVRQDRYFQDIEMENQNLSVPRY